MAYNTNNNHNFKRISRMLQCLREVGLQTWQRPILMALINEFNCGNLDQAQNSLRKHWLNEVKDRTARTQLRKRILGRVKVRHLWLLKWLCEYSR